MKTMSVRDILVSMANMRVGTVLEITRQYNQFVCGERMFAYSGAAVSNDGHKQLSKDDVSAILANNGFIVSADLSIGNQYVPMKLFVSSDAEYRAGSGMQCIEEMQFRSSIRRNMPYSMYDVAGVIVPDDKPRLDKYSTKYEPVPYLPPMPQPTKRVIIHIDIDNDNLDLSAMHCEGSATELIEALLVGAKFESRLRMPMVAAVAALVADDHIMRKKFNDMCEYFSNTPQHG